jgi:hypothetical protein
LEACTRLSHSLVRERQFDCVRGNTDEWIVELGTGGRVPAQGYQADSGTRV